MAWTWHEGTIIKIVQESAQTRRFWVEVDGEGDFDFKAGQFVTMDLPISDKRLKRWRSYSIASAPTGGRCVEFCIVRMEGGAGTAYLFDEAQEGTKIKFKGPDGNFVLPENPSQTHWVFLCTGTGIAPFRSMVLDLVQRQIVPQQIHLIFGTRTEQDVLYRSEMEDLAKAYPWFHYDVALSRATTLPQGEHFHKGYIHPIYISKYAQVLPQTQFLLCGWSNMIDEAVEHLVLELGYPKEQVKYELYG